VIDSKVMKLIINGTEKDIATDNIAALIDSLAAKGDRVAVELNGDIVPRAKWPETPLKDGDRLEIVHFVGGG
jgi:sulfur carrier protein